MPRRQNAGHRRDAQGPKRVANDVEYPAIGVLLNPSALGIPFGAILGHLVQDDRSWHRALKPLGELRVGRLEPGRATGRTVPFQPGLDTAAGPADINRLAGLVGRISQRVDSHSYTTTGPYRIPRSRAVGTCR